MPEKCEDNPGSSTLLVAILGVLGGAIVGAAIYWAATRNCHAAPALTGPSGLDEIRERIRAANHARGQDALALLGYAQKLLDEFESAHGADETTAKLHKLIARVRDRNALTAA